MDLGQLEVGVVLHEVAAIRDWRQLSNVAQHQDLGAEGQQVAPHLFADHARFINDDKIGIGNGAFRIQGAANEFLASEAASIATRGILTRRIVSAPSLRK
jgi:hypothetical protein